MRGVEVGLAQFGMMLGIEPDRPHEAKRLGDVVGELLIAFRLRAVLDEAQHPAMRVFEIGETAVGEGAQQVQRRRRLAIGLQLPLRIGNARGLAELDVVDDVAAIARQLLIALFLGRRGARLGELAGDAPDLDHRRGGGEAQHDRHLQEDAEEIADVVGAVLLEGLGAIAALEQKSLAGRDIGQGAGQIARLSGENERRKSGELAFDRRQSGGVAIDRRLLDRLMSPAARRPTFHCCVTPLFGAEILTPKAAPHLALI